MACSFGLPGFPGKPCTSEALRGDQPGGELQLQPGSGGAAGSARSRRCSPFPGAPTKHIINQCTHMCIYIYILTIHIHLYKYMYIASDLKIRQSNLLWAVWSLRVWLVASLVFRLVSEIFLGSRLLRLLVRRSGSCHC